jgi:hypothetical protein
METSTRKLLTLLVALAAFDHYGFRDVRADPQKRAKQMAEGESVVIP